MTVFIDRLFLALFNDDLIVCVAEAVGDVGALRL